MNLTSSKVYNVIMLFLAHKNQIKGILNESEARLGNVNIPEEYIDLISYYRLSNTFPDMDPQTRALFNQYLNQLDELNIPSFNLTNQTTLPIQENIDNNSLINLMVFFCFDQLSYQDQLNTRQTMLIFLTLNINLREYSERDLPNLPQEYNQLIRLIVNRFNELENGNEILQSFQEHFNESLREDAETNQDDNESIDTYSTIETQTAQVFPNFLAQPPQPENILIPFSDTPPPPPPINDSHLDFLSTRTSLGFLGINFGNPDFNQADFKH